MESKMRIVLTYDQPYEFDEDSPSGIGDHEIRWNLNLTTSIDGVLNDMDARSTVIEFLKGGKCSVPTSRGGDTQYRKFVSLEEVRAIPIDVMAHNRRP